MKPQVFSWLLPSAISVLLLASPSQAAQLEFWRFDTSQNRLHFTTEGGVQPKAQLIANPTRLVIDLPGTTLGRPTVTQPIVKEGFQSIRVGQFESDTARLVIELSPGYTLDPGEVKFRGITANQWTVEVPTPQRLSAVSSGASEPERLYGEASRDQMAIAAGSIQLENVQVTPDGFFIRTQGGEPQIEVQRNNDEGALYVDLQGATISSDMRWRDQLYNQHGVARLNVRQVESSPPVVRLTFLLSDRDSEWLATASGFGGVVLLPNASGSGVPGNVAARSRSRSDRLVEIEGVELQRDGSQILVSSDSPFTYTSGWDRASGAYKISIPSARLSNGVRPPKPTGNRSFLWVRLEQEDPETVAILVQPSAGVRIGQLTQPSPEVLSVALDGPRQTSASSSRGTGSVAPPQRNPRPNSMRLPRNARVVVAIDAGHGGRDPGAIGIGGIQEKDIVLPISERVAAILEQNGVQAILTRSDDREIDLAPRVQLANRVNADLFVSVHANAIDMSRPDVNGIETYYYATGNGLARTIHNSVLQMSGSRDRGVRRARFYVLRHTSMPAVLVEVGFVTGAEDAPRLATVAHQNQLAEAIARGILQYLQNR